MPDHRLDQQPRWTANLGANLAVPGMPLTLGAHVNHTPAFTVRQREAQVSDQRLERAIDACTLWRLDARTQRRLSLTHLAARDQASATTVLLEGGASQRQHTLGRT